MFHETLTSLTLVSLMLGAGPLPAAPPLVLAHVAKRKKGGFSDQG